MTTWQTHIPEVNGILPGGKKLRRTDPSGACTAKIAFLGVYPAATEVKQISVAGKRLNLPTDVEHESFALGSASGREFEGHYLAPLDLERREVMVTDMLPYYLANTSVLGEGKRTPRKERAKAAPRRSMADNVAAYEQAMRVQTGIKSRPPPNTLLKLASDMPGNHERLRWYFGQYSPKLLLTLGRESAAFVRGVTFDDAQAMGDELFYGGPMTRTFAGVRVAVVHLVHPHMFIKQIAKWTTKHREWCAETGRMLVSEVRVER